MQEGTARGMRLGVAAVLAAVLAAAPAIAQSADEDSAFRGFTIGDEESGNLLEIHGSLQADWAALSADDGVHAVAGDFDGGSEIRRARIALSGILYDYLDFKTSVDLDRDGSTLRDLWVETGKLGALGNLRLGQFKEPFGLEQLTGSGSLTFLEKSLASTLAPGRNLGAMLGTQFASKRATWAIGAFHDLVPGDAASTSGSGNEFSLTGRLTWLPWYRDGGRRLVHLGASASTRNLSHGELDYDSPPEVHLAPDIVNTGGFAAESADLLGAECGLVIGVASLQAEYLVSRVDLGGGNDAEFAGYYVQASCFLTGESRDYSRSSGRFGSPEILAPLDGRDDPLGAWEVAARYSRLDLDSDPIFGGNARSATLGLNWYANQNVRVQLNFILSELDTFGDTQAVVLRVQFDW